MNVCSKVLPDKTVLKLGTQRDPQLKPVCVCSEVLPDKIVLKLGTQRDPQLKPVCVCSEVIPDESLEVRDPQLNVCHKAIRDETVLDLG